MNQKNNVRNKPFAELADKEFKELSKAEKKRIKIELLQKKFPSVITARQILTTEYPEPKWVIPTIIPEGLTILAGAPKTGKSWFALNLAIALSCNGYIFGEIQVPQVKTLFLALEDTPRRLKTRLKALNAQHSDNLFFVNNWEQAEPGIDALYLWKKENPETGCIIIDTLQRFRGMSSNGQSYEADYQIITKIKHLADNLEVPIILLHHTRKMESVDPVYDVSGTLGITGACDTVLVLKRERRKSEAVLWAIGRDIDDKEIALRFEDGIGWTYLGDADEFRLSEERKEIIELIKEMEEPLSAKRVSDTLGKNYNTIRNLINKLVKDGILIKVKKGYEYNENKVFP